MQNKVHMLRSTSLVYVSSFATVGIRMGFRPNITVDVCVALVFSTCCITIAMRAFHGRAQRPVDHAPKIREKVALVRIGVGSVVGPSNAASQIGHWRLDSRRLHSRHIAWPHRVYWVVGS